MMMPWGQVGQAMAATSYVPNAATPQVEGMTEAAAAAHNLIEPLAYIQL